MAWTKDKTQFVEFLEDSVWLLSEVQGYLKTRAHEGDVAAVHYEAKQEEALKAYRRVRQSLWKQLALPWSEEGDGGLEGD